MSRTKEPAEWWHLYNGISVREFCKRTGAKPTRIRHLLSLRWFSTDGDRPEAFDLGNRWSLSPAAIEKYKAAEKRWEIEAMRRRTVERWSQGVYIVRAEEGPRRYKVGFASDREKRFNGVQGMSPVKLSIVAWIPGARMTTEARLHKVFRRHRLHGEWFEEFPALLYLIGKYEWNSET